MLTVLTAGYFQPSALALVQYSVEKIIIFSMRDSCVSSEIPPVICYCSRLFQVLEVFCSSFFDRRGKMQ